MTDLQSNQKTTALALLASSGLTYDEARKVWVRAAPDLPLTLLDESMIAMLKERHGYGDVEPVPPPVDEPPAAWSDED